MGDENMEAAAYIAREATAIKDAMVDMRELLGESAQKLENVDKQMDDTAIVVEEADKHLEQAHKHQRAKNKIIICTIVVISVLVLFGIAGVLIYLATSTDVFKAKTTYIPILFICLHMHTHIHI